MTQENPEVPASPAVEAESFFTPAFREKFDYGDVADAEILSEFEELAKFRESAPKPEEIEQLRAAQERYSQIAPHEAEFAEYLKSKQTKQEPVSEKVEDEVPRAPQIPEGLEASVRFAQDNGWLTRDKSGGWVSSLPMYSSLALQANEYEAKRRAFAETIQRDPEGYYTKIAQRESRKLLTPLQEQIKAYEERLNALNQFKVESRIQEELTRNAEKFLKPTEDGRYDHTPYAHAYSNMEAFLKTQMGVTDPEQIHKASLNWAESQAKAMESKEPEDKKKKLVERVRDSRKRVEDRPIPQSDRFKGAMGENAPTFQTLVAEELARRQ